MRSIASIAPFASFALAASSVLAAAAAPRALDEGMWTFDDPPLDALEERYGFRPSPEWLEHLRLASVRLNDGGSGSFVSPDGLVLTNHHVGHEAISELSTPERDLVSDGFLARTRAEELACPDLEMNVLVGIEDVTARVHGAVAEGASEAEARTQREAEIARIEKESMDATGLRSDVIELYRGGRYALYRFKKYTEIKLVFAPEAQAAFFGGDPDNFTFPRYCLDMCLFRAYENGQPASTPHHLRWSTEGPEEGELVFVSGNPGSTGRLSTVAQLEYLRDHYYPLVLRSFVARREALLAYGAQGEEQTRQAAGELFSIDNSIKALGGYHQSLLDEQAMARKIADEAALRARVAGDPDLAREVGSAWDDVARVQEEARTRGAAEFLSNVRGSRLFTIARHVVRLVDELQKPNDQRLPEYRDSALPSLELELYSDAPIYPALEEVALTTWLELTERELGAEHALVQAIASASGPSEASAARAEGSRLLDPAHRRALVEGGPQAVQQSDDPLIRLARALDPLSRELRRWREDEVRSVEERAGARIARARFALLGSSVYPDATFTLRLSFGTVRGFEVAGWNVPWKTTFHGLLERAASFDGEMPYTLPPAFAAATERLDRDTPLNFVCTADIIGGNSGSPIVDRDANLVGLVFDGNIQSLGNRFVYDETVARTVAVHSAGMLEALRNVYGAENLVTEVLGER